MNETMGRFLDESTDEMRDRVITAVEMNDGVNWWDSDERCGCLVGTAFAGDVPYDIRYRISVCGPSAFGPPLGVPPVPWRFAPAHIRYPYAVARFGKDRVVRAVKARAARSNRIDLAVPAEAASVDA